MLYPLNRIIANNTYNARIGLDYADVTDLAESLLENGQDTPVVLIEVHSLEGLERVPPGDRTGIAPRREPLSNEGPWYLLKSGFRRHAAAELIGAECLLGQVAYSVASIQDVDWVSFRSDNARENFERQGFTLREQCLVICNYFSAHPEASVRSAARTLGASKSTVGVWKKIGACLPSEILAVLYALDDGQLAVAGITRNGLEKLADTAVVSADDSLRAFVAEFPAVAEQFEIVAPVAEPATETQPSTPAITGSSTDKPEKTKEQVAKDVYAFLEGVCNKNRKWGKSKEAANLRFFCQYLVKGELNAAKSILATRAKMQDLG